MSNDPYQAPQTDPRQQDLERSPIAWSLILGTTHLFGGCLAFFIRFRLPALEPLSKNIITAVILILAAMLVISGIGLLRQNSWARQLSTVYACGSIALKALLIGTVLLEINSPAVRQEVIFSSLLLGIYPIFSLWALRAPFPEQG